MRYLIDTTVLSLTIRRQSADLNPRERECVRRVLGQLSTFEAGIIGPVAQEVLSGVSLAANFHRMAESVRFFGWFEMTDSDYVEAAKCANACLARGIAYTAVYMLICAVALRLDLTVVTADQDFQGYEKAVGVRIELLGRA